MIKTSISRLHKLTKTKLSDGCNDGIGWSVNVNVTGSVLVFPAVNHFANAAATTAASEKNDQQEPDHDPADNFAEFTQRFEAFLSRVSCVVDRAC